MKSKFTIINKDLSGETNINKVAKIIKNPIDFVESGGSVVLPSEDSVLRPKREIGEIKLDSKSHENASQSLKDMENPKITLESRFVRTSTDDTYMTPSGITNEANLKKRTFNTSEGIELGNHNVLSVNNITAHSDFGIPNNVGDLKLPSAEILSNPPAFTPEVPEYIKKLNKEK